MCEKDPTCVERLAQQLGHTVATQTQYYALTQPLRAVYYHQYYLASI